MTIIVRSAAPATSSLSPSPPAEDPKIVEQHRSSSLNYHPKIMRSPPLGIRSRSLVVALGAALGLMTACVGDDPVAGSGPGSGTDAGVTDAPPGEVEAGGLAADAAPSLHCPLGCLPPAPEGWTGPNAVFDGPTANKPSACPKDYTNKALEGHDGIDVPAATCACGAPSFQGGSCSFKMYRYNASACGGGIASTVDVSTVANKCETVTAPSAIVRFPTLVPGTCTFGASAAPSGPPVTFGKVALSCGLPQVASCNDNPSCVATPLPEPPFTRLCIHQEGVRACPSQDYAVGFVTYTATSEARTCAGCSGTPTGTCGDKYSVSTAACAQKLLTADVGVCNAGAAYDLTDLGPTLSCTPTAPSEPGGTVTQTGPITFCCST
jgi:hypothetical protein